MVWPEKHPRLQFHPFRNCHASSLPPLLPHHPEEVNLNSVKNGQCKHVATASADAKFVAAVQAPPEAVWLTAVTSLQANQRRKSKFKRALRAFRGMVRLKSLMVVMNADSSLFCSLRSAVGGLGCWRRIRPSKDSSFRKEQKSSRT